MTTCTESLTREAAADVLAFLAALDESMVPSQPTLTLIQGGKSEPDAASVASVKPFKSHRAAKMAYTKAEHAWEAARGARVDVEHAQRDPETKVQPTSEQRTYRTKYAGLTAEQLALSPAFDAYCALWNQISDQPRKDAKIIEDATYARMVAAYEQAKAQGFWIKSYHLGCNPTRDLIANNCD